MNRKQAIEKLGGCIFAYDQDRPSLPVADALALKLYDLGYRLIPELKVLGDEEIKGVLDEAYRKIVVGELSQQGMKEYNRNFLRWVAQAQRDYDQKQIKGESCATSAGN